MISESISYSNILILALLSGTATFLGVFLGIRSKKTHSNVAFGTSFAAGLMVLISLFELIPQAYRQSGWSIYLWVAGGILLLWLINLLLPHLHAIEKVDSCDQKCLLKMSYLLSLGLILHDFPEGFAIPSSFQASSSLGFLLIIATFIHNIPEGYVMSVAADGQSFKGFLYRSALYSTISTFTGAMLGVLLISQFGFLNPIFLSIAAGAMLFIALHELLPASLKNHRFKALILGCLASITIYLILAFVF